MGADTELATTSSGWTALHEATYWGKTDLIQVLLDAGAEPNALTSSGQNALHTASQGRYGNEGKAIKMMIEAGTKIDMTDVEDNTPMHSAAMNDCEMCVRQLLNAGALPTHMNSDGHTPIHLAERISAAKVAQIMREHSAPAGEDPVMAKAEAVENVDETVEL